MCLVKSTMLAETVSDEIWTWSKEFCALGKSESLIQFVEDRLGHDWRYAMNKPKWSGSLAGSRRLILKRAYYKPLNGITRVKTGLLLSATWIESIIDLNRYTLGEIDAEPKSRISGYGW